MLIVLQILEEHPLLHACKGANNNYDQHYSDAVLLLEWGASKNTRVD
jgi:hypothetical protein